MTSTSPNGAALNLSMSEFNARAKKIAASTGTIAEGSSRRDAPSRFQRRPAAAKTTPSDS